MARIHWLGAGLSTVPGIRRLIGGGHAVTVWNRSIDKANAATRGLSGNFTVRAFSPELLAADVAAGDVVVSMLPADFHVQMAKICLNADAHFVSSSYISPAMADLGPLARDKGLVLVNEVGLDPGIDHLMAHVLMDDYRQSKAFSPDNAHYFRSYCGGLSDIPNEFRYKFSWSPLGVLKALRSPSRSIRDGAEYVVNHPWEAVENYEMTLQMGHEVFEVYPNRDSLPYIGEYGFGDDWNLQQFVRGTLRYGGWSAAWADLFAEIGALDDGPQGEARLQEISAELWDKYAVSGGEADRVVLSVDLLATKDGKPVYSKSYAMDAFGDNNSTAMARLVSTPVSYAVEAVLDGQFAPGVHCAPNDVAMARKWLTALKAGGESMKLINHLRKK